MPASQKTLDDEIPNQKDMKKKSVPALDVDEIKIPQENKERFNQQLSKKSKENGKNGAIGFEDKLWNAADQLRNNMDSAEYKHVVLGLIFLKYISDSFEIRYNQLQKIENADPEDKDEYIAENVFWVPKSARWSLIKNASKDPKIGIIVDEAMDVIEKENSNLKGVLPKNYARQDLDKIVLGGVIDLISDIGLGDKENHNKDILGKVYEYFLGKFATQEGKGGGEFFTPTSIVRLLVEMIEPFKGRVYDPCCGSGGMFVQSERFVESHGGKLGQISIYGQESNPTTWKLAKMNLAIRGIEANIGPKFADSFHNDLHPSLKADYILANPPFNVKEWGGERLKEDVRWRFGIPPENNANFAWIQHIIHHCSSNGIAGFVLSNGSLSANTSAENSIREKLVNTDLIDCIISLPGKLFLTTGIPASLWFINCNKNRKENRDCRGIILFINIKNYGRMIDRTKKELSDQEIIEISEIYHNWKSKDFNLKYKDIPGLCKSVSNIEIKKSNYILLPAKYIDIKEDEYDSEQLKKEINEAQINLTHLFEAESELMKKILNSLKNIIID